MQFLPDPSYHDLTNGQPGLATLSVMRPLRPPFPILLFLLAVLPVFPASAEEEDARVARIAAYVADCEAFGFTGTVLVALDGEVVFQKGCGFADPETGRVNDADTLFEIASITKVFTACAVLRLAEMQKLALSDSIAEHLPDVPEDKRGITVEMLLAHTSGMSRMVAGGGARIEDAVRSYLAPPLARKPGEAHEYWNGGYALLAGIVETCSGESWEEFCRREVFARAGMTSTGFTGDEALQKERAAVCFDGGVRLRSALEHPYGRYDYGYRGMGGIVTTANDLFRFATAFQDGKVLKPETIAAMTKPPAGGFYGLGIGVLDTARGTKRLVHGGDVRGFHSQFEILPGERGAIVVLGNAERVPMWKLSWTIHALLFGEKPRHAAPPRTAALDETEAARWLGEWKLPGDGGRIVVEREGTALRAGAEGAAAIALLEGTPAKSWDAECRIAGELLAALAAKDPAPIRARLSDHIPRSWPDFLISTTWARHLESHGPLTGSRMLGATPYPQGGARVVIALEHEKKEARLAIAVHGETFSLFTLFGPRFPAERRLAATPDGRLVGYSIETDRRTAEVRLAETDGAKTLVFHTPTDEVVLTR